jgi:hypothetical protein
MTFEHQARMLIHAPFQIPDRVHRLGRGVWLYLWLLDNVNVQGMVCRTSQSIAKSLRIPEGEALDWLGRLVGLGLVEVKSPAPHLIVKLTKWSGHAPVTGQNREEISVNGDEDLNTVRSVNVSYVESKNREDVRHGDGGAGEGADRLLAEVRQTIGDPEGLDTLLTRFSEPVIRRALALTQAKPERELKKSRAALFYFLLKKLNDDTTHAQ